MSKDKEIEQLKEIIKSPIKFIENFCYITTKDATFELMQLTKAQKVVMEYVEYCLEKRIPIRIIILKARQLGFTTLFTQLGTWWAGMHENNNYAVVAHKADSTESIFGKTQITYNNFPKELKASTSKFNSEKVIFDDTKEASLGLRSRIFFGTAGANELFRGETIQFLHKSEVAFWENVRMHNKSLHAAVPFKPFSCIVEESTANGYNHYKEKYDAAVRGENGYKAFFFPWSFQEEYTMEVEEGFEFLDIEMEYMLEHDLTMEQMRWRRMKITSDYGYTLKDIELDDIDDFKQEYPQTPEEAFIASGQGVFNSKIIAKGLEYSRKQSPIDKYELKEYACKETLNIYQEPEVIEKVEYRQKVQWSEELQDYEYIDTDLVDSIKYYHSSYLVAIDTSGLGQDNNVISVWNTITKRKVAQWKKTIIDEEYLAIVAVEIAKIYHNAMIAPEVNFSHSLCNFILKLGYSNIYIEEDPTKIATLSGGGGMKYGWITSTKTKPLIVSMMKKALNEDYTICPDRDFWEEAEYYLHNRSEKTGRDTYNASPGKHDDVVMSSMIGRFLCDSPLVKQNYIVSDKKKEYTRNSSKKTFMGMSIGKPQKNNKYSKGAFRNNA